RIARDGHFREETIDTLFTYEGLGRKKVPEASAGDIVAVTGMAEVGIGDTLADPENPQPMPIIPVDEPTLSMVFSINNSPFAGREGKFLTTRHVRDRLMKELQSNVALRVEEMTQKDQFRVSGRGLLHLGVLIETMRREGYELMVGKPKVIYR